MPDAATPEPVPPLVDVIVEDPRWDAIGLDAVAKRAASATLIAEDREPSLHEISLLACDDARSAALNATFRDKPRPTNVLSWPAFAGDIPQPLPGGHDVLFLGDLALAYDICASEAAAAGISLADHAAHLIVHGCLHLLGHDHIDDGEAACMEALETKILAPMGIANPYTNQ